MLTEAASVARGFFPVGAAGARCCDPPATEAETALVDEFAFGMLRNRERIAELDRRLGGGWHRCPRRRS